MPIKQQAKKALRQNLKRAEYNLKIREDLKTLLKKARKAIDAKKDKEEIEKLLHQAQMSIDKAVQKSVLKKNNGARKLSRLMAYFHKVNSETAK